jgi:protein-S-isoprenylcysteine O-methyltransferase Ste14
MQSFASEKEPALLADSSIAWKFLSVRWFGFKQYLANLALIWIFIFIVRTNKFYARFLRMETQLALFNAALIFTVCGLLVLLIFPKTIPQSKAYIALTAIARIARQAVSYLKAFPTHYGVAAPSITRQEKISILFLLVKAFFLPVMLNFLFSNYTEAQGHFIQWNFRWSIYIFNTVLYPLALAMILFVDTLFFSFGYLIESKHIGSSVRSVEPTVLGWAVALGCYPPMSGFVSSYLNWYAKPDARFTSETGAFVLRIMIILLFLVYLWATVALGAKASNLTNRGVVAKGPYAFIRHPAYASKNLAWWLMILPVFSFWAAISMIAWSSIYFLRAITEERHLLQDPDYREYCKNVRYRFVPGIW